MQLEQVAVQLYTLRDLLKTARDAAATLKHVVAIGYRTVEVAAVDFNIIPEADFQQMLADNDLGVCALHGNPETLLADPAVEIERAMHLGVDTLVYPYPAGIDTTDESDVRRLLRGLNKCLALAAASSITLAYHNHHHEFKRLSGNLLLQTIFAELKQAGLVAELDTYWVQYGGGDPVDWCKQMAGRLPLLHLKDYRINTDNEPEFAPLGEGNLNIPAIVEAADSAGCKWFIVEQDNCAGDPIDAITHSYNYLKSLAAS